jgi:hypothetical protein
MAAECSLPCWEEPATGPYPEPDKPSPHVFISLGFILILYYYLRSAQPNDPFTSGFSAKIL